MIEGQEEHARAMISQAQARVMWIGHRRSIARAGSRSSERVHAARGMGEGNGRACKAGALVGWQRTSSEPPGPAAEPLAEHGENSFAKSEMAKLLFAP